jgi:hypothetical protein
MGNTPTKETESTVKSVSKAVSNIISKSLSKCMIQSEQSQNMNFSCSYSAKELLEFENSPSCLLALKISGEHPGNPQYMDVADSTCNKCYYKNNSQDMKLTVDAKCDISASVTDEIHDSIRNDLKQKVDIKEDSLGGIFGDNNTTANKTIAETVLIKNITTETISEAITEASQLQVLTASDSVAIGNSQKMVGDVIFSAMMKNEKFNKAIAEVVNIADQSVKMDTTNPFSTLVKTAGDVASKLIAMPAQLLGAAGDFLKIAFVFVFVYLLYTNGIISGTPPEEDLDKFARSAERSAKRFQKNDYDEDNQPRNRNKSNRNSKNSRNYYNRPSRQDDYNNETQNYLDGDE